MDGNQIMPISICPNCGEPSEVEDRYCRNCGRPKTVSSGSQITQLQTPSPASSQTIEFIPAVCPNCGGELRVPENRKVVKCMYCGYDVIIQFKGGNSEIPVDTQTSAFITAYANRIVDYLDKREYDLAIKECTKLIELDSYNKMAYLQRAKAYLGKREGRHDFQFYEVPENLQLPNKALSDCSKALEIDPDFVLALVARADLKLRPELLISDYEGALEDCKRALLLDPNNIKARELQAKAYFYIGDGFRDPMEYDKINKKIVYTHKPDYDEAINNYSLAIRSKPNYWDAYYFRGLCYEGKKEINQAIQDFSRAIEINPEGKEAYIERSSLFYEQGDRGKAFADINQVMNIDPKYWEAYFTQGRFYQIEGKFITATQNYSKVITFGHKYLWASAYYYRGSCYRLMGKYEAAIQDYNKVTDIESDWAESELGYWAWAWLGYIYYHVDEFKQSIDCCTKAIKKAPDNGWAYMIRGETYFRIGRYRESLLDLDQAISIGNAGSWEYYLRALVYIVKHDLTQAKRDLKRAIELGTEVIEKSPEDWIMLLNLGLYNLVTGDFEKAESYYRRVINSSATALTIKLGMEDCRVLSKVYPNNKKIKEIIGLLTHACKSRK
jgi:tetratricopeptide (TPR) repeat protein